LEVGEENNTEMCLKEMIGSEGRHRFHCQIFVFTVNELYLNSLGIW